MTEHTSIGNVVSNDAELQDPDSPAAETDVAAPPPKRRWLRWSAKWAVRGCVLLCLLGLVVRLTIRDRVYPLSVAYYALPPVVMALLCLLACAICAVRKSRRAALVLGLAGLMNAGWWYQTSHVRNDPTFAADGIPVLFWNICRGYAGRDAVIEEIRRFDAPIIGLVEAGPNHWSMDRLWRRKSPEYEFVMFKRGMVLLTKGRILRTGNRALPEGGRWSRIEIEYEGQLLTIFLVDISSNPLRTRNRQLTALAKILEQYSDRPLLVMGDFNTPSDSVFFADLRRDFSNVFELAGNGFSETWPVPVPLLVLDQVWVNRQFKVNDCRLEWSWYSDHRPIMTNLSVVPR